MGEVTRIVIPYKPRDVFMGFHNRVERWACIVAHRRAGKTVACINDLIRRAIDESKPDGKYFYVAPYYNQAKSVAWDYLLKFSEPIRTQANHSELWVELINGARIRLFGSDNADAMRGLAIDGIIIDETADHKPRVWGEIIRPALADRQGWAVFIGTPKGHDAFYKIYNDAKQNAAWYVKSVRASESNILPAAELLDASKSMTEDQYQQEFECSFEAAIMGAIYAKEIGDAKESGRVCSVPYDMSAKVDTWWDLGVGDATAIIFSQSVGREIRIIDHYEASGEGLPHYAAILDKKGYLYGSHNAPHDIQVRELGSGRSRLETAANLGIRFNVVPNIGLEDGINAARLSFNRIWFDERKCSNLVESLTRYRWDQNEKTGMLKPRPIHDEHSHSADAFRYMAVGIQEQRTAKKQFNGNISWMG